MIRSFKNSDTEATHQGRHARRIPADIRRRAQRKLIQLDAADALVAGPTVGHVDRGATTRRPTPATRRSRPRCPPP